MKSDLTAGLCWTRRDLFVTNAVLCNPRSASGSGNRPPTRAELRNCSGWLEAQIALVNPVLVLTLGGVALSALALIKPHPIRLCMSVGELHSWATR